MVLVGTVWYWYHRTSGTYHTVPVPVLHQIQIVELGVTLNFRRGGKMGPKKRFVFVGAATALDLTFVFCYAKKFQI